MSTPASDPDFLNTVLTRRAVDGNVFWVNPDELVVFDAAAAVQANRINFADLTLPDRLVDLLRRRPSPIVSWRQVRAAWATQLRRLTRPAAITGLTSRVLAGFDTRLGRDLDLVRLMHDVTIEALVPVVIDGLPARDATAVRRDLRVKLNRLLAPGHRAGPLEHPVVAQVLGGLAVRREIRGRAGGRRPRRLDLTDPIVGLLPQLGMDRAVDAVTTMLTAISGPPGAAATAVLYELVNRPEWTARLAAEHRGLSLSMLLGSGQRAVPQTRRFIAEVLRLWSPPLMLSRAVRAPIELPQACLAVGQRFLLSPYMIHHDPAVWPGPEAFDPDRWLPDAPNRPPDGAHYVPFGWTPRSCIGAGLGLTYLTVLCYLLTTRYQVTTDPAGRGRMVLAAIPTPLDFRGRVDRRPPMSPRPGPDPSPRP